ncbi:MAG: helix-turn-helix domain-containing protein [Planctomycetes bacterium]|nr:helix-turn-helix domain-containing protein [Planctomycetota bacterium]
METFRDYLDVLCRVHNVQYSELARRIGVTKSYIGQLIHGHSKPAPQRRVEQIADAMALSLDERKRLVDLAVRERARSEARSKIEELDRSVSTLRSATGELLLNTLANLTAEGQPLPEAVQQLLGQDEVLASLHAAVTADEALPGSAIEAKLAAIPPARLASALNALTAAVGAAKAVEGGAAPVIRQPDIPVIGYVAAGETDIAFTDAGLPVGAGLPGEEPVARWPGAGHHSYALRVSGESMLPLCPPGTTIVIDPDRTPRSGEPAICQTIEGKSYFKLIHFETSGRVRLVSTNATQPEIILQRSHVRRLQKVVATIYP